MKRKPRSKPTTLGQRLRAARLAAGLRQSDASDATGIHADVIGRYERGDRRPYADDLIKLARLYNITCGELLD
jgi:transcriptional regulator with XRE-family HTH domain